MATHLKNLSDFSTSSIPSSKGMKFEIVVAEWNVEITGALLQGAVDILKKQGTSEDDIRIHWVPGSFELPTGARYVIQSNCDAVICLGCVIQGETRHFDFICSAVAHGCTDLAIQYNKPVIFGVLTPNTQEQAMDRAGGKHGNKGDEAAVTAIKMVALKNSVSQ